MKKEVSKLMKDEKGITLVALVVTIVVLLILAGITITYVMGDNSIFKQAQNAKLNTELAKIEEQASLIYEDKLLEKAQTNFNNKPTMQEIVGELRDKGYTIEQVAVSGNEITGISLDKESMSLGKDKSNTIQVTLEGSTESYNYYVKVEEKYYRMHFNGGVVTIDRTESDITSSGEGTTQNVTVSSGDEAIATATINTNTNVVTVTAKSIEGTVAITVTYGSYTKVCNVRVCEVATEIELNSVRARIATGYTRWLNAVAKPVDVASQGLEWSSSNLEVATVDDKGVITAKKKGTTTITVKTTDESNLSKTCEVTVDDAVEVKTLTDFQTQNTIAKDENGNLITVPGDFKVLTSEGTKVTEGIVIQDREGNEFVWVPVDSVSTGTSKPADDIRLGRYEASQGDDRKVDSQYDKTAWVSISQPDAATVARGMYDNSHIESDLINSYSWDTAIVFIQRYSENTNYANKTSVNSSKLKTGKAGDKVCNIHDMASNYMEWSTENSTDKIDLCVFRGGSYAFSDYTMSDRYKRNETSSNSSISFRPILYVK